MFTNNYLYILYYCKLFIWSGSWRGATTENQEYLDHQFQLWFLLEKGCCYLPYFNGLIEIPTEHSKKCVPKAKLGFLKTVWAMTKYRGIASVRLCGDFFKKVSFSVFLSSAVVEFLYSQVFLVTFLTKKVTKARMPVVILANWKLSPAKTKNQHKYLIFS